MSYPPPPPPPPPSQPPPPPGPHWATPPPPPRKRSPLPWIIGGVVAVVLICCGGLVAIGIWGPDPDKPAAQQSPPAPPATTAPAVEPKPTAAPTTQAPATTVPPKPPVAKPPTTFVMPRLVGLNAAVAVDRLKRLGVPEENIHLGSQDEDDTFVILPENWTVTKQSEKAGARVALDAVVVLTCTKD